MECVFHSLFKNYQITQVLLDLPEPDSDSFVPAFKSYLHVANKLKLRIKVIKLLENQKRMEFQSK